MAFHTKSFKRHRQPHKNDEMKRMIITAALFAAGIVTAGAQTLRPEAFELLDLDYPGLENVRALHNEGEDLQAAYALLDYYRHRTGITTPEIRDISKIKITGQQQKWADDALQHTFFVHKGYQPSFNYGEDIDWRYWPIKDNELRWQLHRHKWFTPMGYAYRVSGDEKYAEEWVRQYMDWIRKNPFVKIDKQEYELTSDSVLKADAENARFAWRPLEVSHRLQDQTFQFQLFIDSPAFTPEFLTEFIVNYYRHATHIINNYSKQGNHLLFEAQRMLYAGSFFPEFKEAGKWRKSGVDILNRTIRTRSALPPCLHRDFYEIASYRRPQRFPQRISGELYGHCRRYDNVLSQHLFSGLYKPLFQRRENNGQKRSPVTSEKVERAFP